LFSSVKEEILTRIYTLWTNTPLLTLSVMLTMLSQPSGK